MFRRKRGVVNRLLIFGGAFDPVHRGHLALLKAADRALKPDGIVLLPSGNPPHKPGPAAPFQERKALLRLALGLAEARAWAGKARIDDFESRGRGPHYTYRSLRRLRRLHPAAEMFLLMGTDQLAALGTWRRLEEIRRTARIAAGVRRGVPRPGTSGAVWIPGRFPAVSSSALRAALAEGRDPGRLLPRAVLKRIRARGLYGTGWHRWLRERLTPERYRHTLSVTRLASELAGRHGQDVWKARTAALLHDAGRSLSARGMVRYARRHRLPVPLRRAVEAHQPMLLHAFVGADIARRRFAVRDPEVLGAIERHTLGAPGMTPLETVLYVADVASEDRAFPGARRIRALARRNLWRALAVAARNKIAWVKSSEHWLHPLGPALERWSRTRPWRAPRGRSARRSC
jgi:nicotinate-nucleotide adenylyltransferase